MAGIFGTLVGLGGAFIVIPVLRIAFGVAPALTAGISLVMVLANGISGSIGYLRQRRVDWRLALLIVSTGVPTSIVGALVVQRVSHAGFDLLYGAMLILLFFNVMRRRRESLMATPPVSDVTGMKERVLIDAGGTKFRYFYNAKLTLAAGLFMGFVSSFFGIGGGVVFMTLAIAKFRMPVHIIAATSTVAMLLTAPVGVATHAMAGDIEWSFALPLACGGLIGGQIGPQIGKRLSTPQLLTALAYAMLIAAVALAARHLFPA